ncbi:MAG: hypothetical protein QXO15_08140 [Nitrososphaerota archaeon]
MENNKEEKPKLGPFIAGLYTAAVRNSEAAKNILKEEGEKLTPEQRAYLEHVIEEGKRARKFLEEHGIYIKPRDEII